MAKGDSKRARTAIESQRGLQLGQQAGLSSKFNTAYDTDRGLDLATRGNIEERYKNFNPDYDYSKILESMGGGGGGGVSGGIDPGRISEFGKDPYAGYKKMSEGLRPEFWADFNKYMGTLDESIKGYKGFSETGGFSENELAGIRNRSNSPTRSIYANMQNELSRQSSLGNINSPLARLRGAREANSAISDVVGNTEAGISEQVQKGKQFGLQGMERAGLAGGAARTQVEALDQQMRAAGLGGMTDIEKARLEAELQNASINSSASAANANLAQRRAEAVLQGQITANNQKLAALGGWQDLYGTAPGASGQDANELLALQGLSQSGNAGLIGQQIEASQIPSDFSQAMGNIGSAVGLAGQVGGLIAGIPGAGKIKLPGMGGITKGAYGGYGGYGYGTENLPDQAGY